MTKTKVFISYRRFDATDVVRALYFQLRLKFGSSQVFMDVSSIAAGEVWPERIKRALLEASVVLAVVGPSWLKAADQHGRRRIDMESDWVRAELQTALELAKPIVPLLVGGITNLPLADALPSQLGALVFQQQAVLRDDRWEDDVQSLSNLLNSYYGLQFSDEGVIYPIRKKTREPILGEAELFTRLGALEGWEPVETFIPRDYPRSRHELRRAFRFSKFKDAIAFLQLLVGPLNALEHHPRIESQWRTVFIHFSTWDVDNRITALDVEAARIVDQIYNDFRLGLLAQI